MTERTITKEQLKAALEAGNLNYTTTDFILHWAFPPIFKPKNGEVVLASDDKDFSVPIFYEFSHMGSLNNYICNYEGKLRAFLYAKPQTPTQKGE
jgi:hypothetical protein